MSQIGNRRRCAYCSRPALFLCDLTVRHVSKPEGQPESCHMPICAEHRVRDVDLDLCRNHHRLLHPEAESAQEAMA
jgi:hypothetical protein